MRFFDSFNIWLRQRLKGLPVPVVVVVIILVLLLSVFVLAAIPVLFFYLVRFLLYRFDLLASPETFKMFEPAVLFTFFIAWMLFLRYGVFGGKQKCKICGTAAAEMLRHNNSKTYYCRNHLVEIFLKEMSERTSKAVVLEPNFKAKNINIGFGQYDKEDLKSYYLMNLPGLDLEKRLALIKGKCKCGQEAKIRYYKGAKFFFKDGVVSKVVIPTDAENICYHCAARRLQPLLQQEEKTFNEGFFDGDDIESAYFIFV